MDSVELFYIEPNPTNRADLTAELAGESPPAGVTAVAGGACRVRARCAAGPGSVGNRPSFWFIDPFGFSGLPLTLIGQILSRPRPEVFMTFMSRDMNRLLDVRQHRKASMSTLGLETGNSTR